MGDHRSLAEINKNTVFPYDREKFENLSDFVVKSKTRVFKCHKFKLAWNSEFFETMFQHTSFVENQSGEIKIESFDDDTVEHFIDYLYKGKLEDEAKYTPDLIAMAHMYQVLTILEKSRSEVVHGKKKTSKVIGPIRPTNRIYPFDRKRFENLSDIVVKSKSKEFKCHKFKLAWNSEVFDAMFRDADFLESQKAEIKIEDFDDDTVDYFIEFLYAGGSWHPHCCEWVPKYTTELLAMAYKYQVVRMQKLCIEFLVCGGITKKNVAKAWIMAETHQITTLIPVIHKFLLENWKDRNECPGLEEVAITHPHYMVDLFSVSARFYESFTRHGRLMTISVKKLTGRIPLIIVVKSSDTVEMVKRKIYDREAIPIDQQRIIFEGRQLDDWSILSECNVTDESLLHLIIRLGCGRPPGYWDPYNSDGDDNPVFSM